MGGRLGNLVELNRRSPNRGREIMVDKAVDEEEGQIELDGCILIFGP
jgi:hypothetical protein